MTLIFQGTLPNFFMPVFVCIPIGLSLARSVVESPFTVHPEGIVFWKRGRWQTCLWHDIDAIWHTGTFTYHGDTVSITEKHTIEIMRNDGICFKLKDLYGESANWIEEQVYGSLVPQIRARWAKGETIKFGPLSLSPTGVHAGRDCLPWRNVASVKAERQGMDIVIRQIGRKFPWKKLEDPVMPNEAIFFQLAMEQICKQDE